MKSFQIIFEKKEKYEAIIYAVSYNNPINDIEEISKCIRTRLNGSGYVLFDLLLSNGENFNRFAEGYFDGNDVLFDSLKVVNLGDFDVQSINGFYRSNKRFLNNSVLSPSERFKFSKNDKKEL